MNAKEKREDHLHAVWFAAGTAVAVACLQRATVASIVERWRVWVFLTLNLLLLAILFTSTCTSNHTFSTSSEDESSRESNTDVQHDTSESKEGRKQNQFRRNARADEPSKLAKSSGGKRGDDERQVVEDEDNEDGAKPSHQLSKEELNERVEAFIAMFRQQLVSDAKSRRSRLPYSAGARKHFA